MQFRVRWSKYREIPGQLIVTSNQIYRLDPRHLKVISSLLLYNHRVITVLRIRVEYKVTKCRKFSKAYDVPKYRTFSIPNYFNPFSKDHLSSLFSPSRQFRDTFSVRTIVVSPQTIYLTSYPYCNNSSRKSMTRPKNFEFTIHSADLTPHRPELAGIGATNV